LIFVVVVFIFVLSASIVVVAAVAVMVMSKVHRANQVAHASRTVHEQAKGLIARLHSHGPEKSAPQSQQLKIRRKLAQWRLLARGFLRV
jgi:hypothetical protein